MLQNETANPRKRKAFLCSWVPGLGGQFLAAAISWERDGCHAPRNIPLPVTDQCSAALSIRHLTRGTTPSLSISKAFDKIVPFPAPEIRGERELSWERRKAGEKLMSFPQPHTNLDRVLNITALEL